MSTRIPLPGLPWDTFNQRIQTGSNAFSKLMNSKYQQQQIEQQQKNLELKQFIQELMQKRHEDNLAIKQGNLDIRKEESPYNIDKTKALKDYYNERTTSSSIKRSPEQQQEIREKFMSKIPKGEGLDDAVPMFDYSVNERHAARKRMNEELSSIQNAKVIEHHIAQAKDITKNNPDLYRKAVGIIVNPEADPGKIDSSLRAIIPKEQLTPFIQLHKTYADILTRLAQKQGMSRSVYALRLQASTKPQAKNPDEANEMMLDNILHEIKPQIAREKPLIYALKNNLDLPYSVDYAPYEPPKNKEQVNNQNAQNKQQPTNQKPVKMLRGVINGKEVAVHPTQREDFIKAKGRIL